MSGQRFLTDTVLWLGDSRCGRAVALNVRRLDTSLWLDHWRKAQSYESVQREPGQCPLSNSGCKSFTKKMQTWRTTLRDVRSTRVLPSHLCICGWDTSDMLHQRQKSWNQSPFVFLVALRQFLLASVYISILHMAVILISMNSIFDVTHHLSFYECDVSESECVLIKTVLLLFWTPPTVLPFYNTMFRKLVVLNDVRVHKTFVDSAAREEAPWIWGPPNVEKTKIRFGLFRTGVLSSDRRQYSESRL